jgi:hypothetical protein
LGGLFRHHWLLGWLRCLNSNVEKSRAKELNCPKSQLRYFGESDADFGLAGQVLIQAINRGVNASGGSLHIGILQALGEAMLQIAQFNDETFRNGPKAALAIALAGR